MKEHKSISPIDINKTGRICFNQEAQEHIGDKEFMKAEVHKGVIGLEPTDEKIYGAMRVSRIKKTKAVYISEGQARPLLEPLGFDGSRPYDIDDLRYPAKGGFEFRLP